MTFPEVIRLVLGESATLGLAVVSLWLLNKTWEARIAESKVYAASLVQMTEQNRQAIERNTEAWARMLERVDK